MARLEYWSLVGKSGTKPLAIRGEIHGDERFSDGTPITSSRLHYLDPEGHFACTKNHTYELGAISDAFARWMTDAGKMVASYANALEGESAPKLQRATVTPIAPRPATITRATATAPAVATALVQTPTLIVAAR